MRYTLNMQDGTTCHANTMQDVKDIYREMKDCGVAYMVASIPRVNNRGEVHDVLEYIKLVA